MTFGYPNPLVVEFQTKVYIKIWTIVMKYTDFQLIWRFESMIFRAKHFFRERSLHKTVHKLRGTFITLGHAGRKKYFNDFLYHFAQKMRLAFGSMTFQTLCIFRTGYPNVQLLFFGTFLLKGDTFHLKKRHSIQQLQWTFLARPPSFLIFSTRSQSFVSTLTSTINVRSENSHYGHPFGPTIRDFLFRKIE